MICTPAAGRPAFRGGERGIGRAESTARMAQMITTLRKQTRSLCGGNGQAQSPSGEALATRQRDIQRPIGDASRKTFERIAVIARCGMPHRAGCPAWHAEAGRRRERRPREQCAMTASPRREGKVFELPSEKPRSGSRNEEVQCLCGIGVRLRPVTYAVD